MRKAYLVLADGSVYEGVGFGAEKNTIGELVFQTGVVGYVETLTDPCYAGQIVMQTFPLIGNYGIAEEDICGNCRLQGYVVRQWCDTPSNFRSQYDLDTFLKDRGIPGICGLDTRAITRKIRDCGSMNAMICSQVPEDLSALQSFHITGEVEKCSCKAVSVHNAVGVQKYSVAVIDYGAVNSLVDELTGRGCSVTVYPAATPAANILSAGHDGIVLSGGPGDPAENTYFIEQIKAILGKLPIYGIGLGHQMLAIAAGGHTEKMHCGHRGGNQPVKDAKGSRSYITSQNHGYTVVSDSVPGGEFRFVNGNDGSCEGMDYPALCAFSTQFYPQVCIGPQDTSFLYDRFISMMGGEA